MKKQAHKHTPRATKGPRSYVWCPAGHYVVVVGQDRTRAIVAHRVHVHGCAMNGTCRRVR